MECKKKNIDPCNSCMVCDKHSPRRLYSVKDTNQNVPGLWDILICDECGTGVLSPFPTQSEISSYYQDLFYTSDGKRFRGWMESLRAIFATLRGRILNSLVPAKGRLLDFGSGAGHFARAQEKKGWVVVPVDPYSSASKDTKCSQGADGTFKLLYPDNHFDAVTTWYVIEHLRDPRAAIAEFCRVLKPGGVLLLAQQDFSSMQAKFFGPCWLYLDPPRHLWQFSLKSIVRLAQEQQLKLERTSFSSLEMSPFCMLQSSLNMLLGNHNDLFHFLKNRKLPIDRSGEWGVQVFRTAASLALLPVIAPIIIFLYFALLFVESGDVVEVYLRKY